MHFKGIDTTLDGDRKTEVEPTDKQSSVPDDEGAESDGGDGGASRDDPRITRQVCALATKYCSEVKTLGGGGTVLGKALLVRHWFE